MAEGALFDVKVVDLSQHVAGPYCTKHLADYGAEVIKIERPDGGDPARRIGPFPGDVPHPEKSGLFLHLNTNKKSVTLNLKTETGKKILKELVKDADLLVENYPPKEAQSLGVSYEEMEKVNPRLVMTSITPFGQTGPYRDFKATEIVIYAMGGAMIDTGVREREPLKYYGSASEVQAALDANVATLAALRYARQTGIGQHVDVAIFQALLSTIDRRAAYFTTFQYSGRTENYRVLEAPADQMVSALVLPCKDGYVQFSASGLAQFNYYRVFPWIGHPELVDDPRFATPELRMSEEQRGMTDALIRSFFLDHTMAELMDGMQEFEIPGGVIYSVADVVADPHMVARQFFVEIDHPVAGKFRHPGAFARPQETPWKAGRAPLLGEHNVEIYCDRLGYSKEDLVRLRERDVI